MASRPSMPNEVKRQLRQEAGFGCCQCGHPFIQYHHIIPFAVEEHFRAEDMMVLCPNHHALCTTGAITEREQRALKARPHNIVDDLVRGALYVTSNRLEVFLGGGVAINTRRLLHVRNEDILAARLDNDSRVLISAAIQNSNGEVVARLVDNEWSLIPSAVWDFEVGHRNATVRSAAREIAFEVDCRDDQVRLAGRWFVGGTPIIFSPSQVQFGSHVLHGMRVERASGFMRVD